MSDPAFYPYARMDVDGYELEVVEQADGENHPFLRNRIPDDEQRLAATLGDVVKLIFRYREAADWDGQPINSEHMWVLITGFGDGYLIGNLDSPPRFTQLLRIDDIIHFHPKHIVNFWSDEQSEMENVPQQYS